MIKKIILAVGVLSSFTLASFGSDIATVLNVKAFGGQYSYEGESASNGNLNIDFVPAMKFSDKFSFLPALYVEYRGVKDVTELVGGEKLLQQSASYNLSLRPVYKIGENTKLRAKVGYFKQMIIEAKDESWGNGAFDYAKTSVGLDVSKKNINIGYSMYIIAFPNYASLVSQTSGQFGVSATDIGKNLLDFMANEVSLYGKFYPLSGFVVDWSFAYTMKSFNDQTIQLDNGVYNASQKRADTVMGVGLFPSFAIVPTGPLTMFGGLSINYVSNASNQNRYDTAKKQFIEKDYDYTETKIAPIISFSFNTVPLKLDFSYEIGSRAYLNRLVQDVAGVYGTDKIKTDTTYLSLGLTYPLSEKLSLKGIYGSYNSSSSMKYEQVYKYTYQTSNMFLGVAYEL
ncbi:MAG: hypothetical protein A2252_10420 [Elusimicrobia bacterium RIFOXYA2_FULL_39_19]|nr:MAG: hypothetical protein A2252_10420 [Elusimicrobia bacterium RIFOXYA2_FULL_39_19]